MKVVISGGGTGGHIYPAIAIANKIKEENPKAEILFIGTEKGLESDIVPKAGYKIKHIPVSYLKRKISLHNLKSGGLLLKGLMEARRILKDFKPDVVVGTGGFVCGPVLFIAAKLKIKTLIHESNVFPGLTNRILARYVDVIAVSFDDAKKYFKDLNKIIVTGNPIREDFLKVTEAEALIKYPKHPNKPLILVVGGSGGSAKLNNAVIQLLEKHPNDQFELLWATGKNHYSKVMDSLPKSSSTIEKHRIVPYINDMPYALKACDLIITSAGAMLLSELTAAGKASILIPKAHTAENHQEYNARALADKGAAIMIKENNLTGESLYNGIDKILQHSDGLDKMKLASRQQARVEGNEKIYEAIVKLLR
ncbi:undecaprenyldiphospho-muramoylpentapeptide beta-N-acetylglucosaminyltransferase [Alkaliphilus hydrothermalis]|uniref:UDP-N-acetylglucosamine--N-acetylmuramyl-(pentapeptide) pyrophosphoryl-undecaprenol N-acetylglucosamine transferase n=1 Tax=Alkaliphilus hydrothermalis TaxID=1482730 RepID=A0ABS2NNS1_9FIRM|nr:undecaprenyldiphospho-muramoylpentapeptide beta-N-acetylglucosaminyltransferase [Alkaliphilus hydrothermalis]MBM7614587.1 UDP-N-acetylglucosamine--N-acetylmuramyl-(pentapeptide) pyrophosphoryl-undecaprenol N-acetylglucosamine transferase [Alkaliphilus hydrothermalis]